MNFEREIFKELVVEGFEGLYLIGSYGTLISKERISESINHQGERYFRVKKEKVITQTCSKNSLLLYVVLQRTIYDDYSNPTRVIKTIYTHQEVGRHFLFPSKNPRLTKIAHIDNNPHNNFYKNLSWEDQSFFTRRSLFQHPELKWNFKKVLIKKGLYGKKKGTNQVP